MNELFLLTMILIAIIGTPGPNNTVLFFSGLHKGYRNSLKLLFAINFGAVSMVTISSIAVGFAYSLFTAIENYLWILSATLLIYISYKMWPRNIYDSKKSATDTLNISIISMLFFQFINPKVWLASITVATSFQNQLSVFIIVLLTIIVGLSLNSLWVILGTGIGKMQVKVPNEILSKMGSIILFLSALFFFFSYF